MPRAVWAAPGLVILTEAQAIGRYCSPMSLEHEVLAQVEALERRLLDPLVRGDEDAVDALLHPAFVEFGASGRVWDRSATIASLHADPGDVATTMADLQAAFVSEDCVLLTFRTDRNGRAVLRSSLWCFDDGAWRIRFHQGTPTP